MRRGRPVEQKPDTLARIALERSQGRSMRAIANDLNDEGVPTARGGKRHPSTCSDPSNQSPCPAGSPSCGCCLSQRW
ncbi:MAG: recombinase family protein [Acidimicrobiales bacterium]